MLLEIESKTNYVYKNLKKIYLIITIYFFSMNDLEKALQIQKLNKKKQKTKKSKKKKKKKYS